MRNQGLALRALLGVAVAAVGAAPAHAQDGPLRRFTTEPMDTNRSNRVAYVPLGWKFTDARPGKLQYGVAGAAWYRQPLGSQNVKPDSNLDKGQYLLERFELAGSPAGAPPRARVVITRRPGPAPGVELPQLELVDAETQISAQRAAPSVERLSDGVRYTFTVTPPLWGVTTSRSGSRGEQRRYELRFLPESGVRVPQYLTGAPTFGGADLETRMNQGPPHLPVEERVAGKRIEYRSGRVIEEPKKD